MGDKEVKGRSYICISEKLNITLHKSYEVVGIYISDYYYIYNDLMILTNYHKSHFISIEEYRDIKIKSLL